MAGFSSGRASAEWGVRWRPVPSARVRLFCLPHAGGGTAAYRTWADRLPPDIEVVAVRLPGRETRLAEQPFTRLDDLVQAMLDGLEPWMDRPHAWFGHSMGALVAFEACRTSRRLCLAEPTQLFVSGLCAPHLDRGERPSSDMEPGRIADWLRELNGTPAEVADDPAALVAYLPTLRADLSVVEQYRYHPERPLDCAISAFGGVDDDATTVAGLKAWDSYSTTGCKLRMFPGSHFFVQCSQAPLLTAIAADLAEHYPIHH